MITYEDFRDKRREYAFTKSVSKDPKDQDDARKIRVQMDYDDLKKQIGSKKKPQVAANAVVEGDYHSGQGEKIQARTKKWMDKKGQKGAPGLDAMKARTAEHKAKRGVSEAKVDDVKYSKDEKRKNYETDVHTLSVNKGVRSDRNKRLSATDVIFHGHSKVERDRKQTHYKSRGVKKVKGVKEATDKALAAVRASIEKEHGKGAIYDPKKKQSPADKAKVAAERKKRQAADNKAFAGRAKKAGYKNPQDYANVVARYGGEDNMKKGRGLGT